MLTKDPRPTDMPSIKTDRSKQDNLSTSQKRRNRRKKQASVSKEDDTNLTSSNSVPCLAPEGISNALAGRLGLTSEPDIINTEMSTPEQKSRDEVKAAREAKKLAKQKGKLKVDTTNVPSTAAPEKQIKVEKDKEITKNMSSTSKDEVDRAVTIQKDIIELEKSKEQVQAERAAKKAAKQAKKKGDATGDSVTKDTIEKVVDKTMASIAEVTKDLQEVHAKPAESDKSKAELKSERRAKQEAQRAAKQAQQAETKPKEAAKTKEVVKTPSDKASPAKEIKPKSKTLERSKTKSQFDHRVNWFQHLYTERNENALKNVTLNSNLHPAIVKLGVQLATRVITGSNARCIALLDALKKMISDYSLPAKTEFARGLESALTTCVDYLWSMRQPAASQTNAIKFLRYHLTQLPNNVDEFDAKKTLHEEIDRYIREQIDMAGEAISLAVRNKISDGDTILTYGYSSLIERILISAWESGVKYSCVVVGSRTGPGSKATALLRRLRATNLPCVYCDITAISGLIHTIDKVVVGASSLLVNGSVLGAAGTSQVALCAKTNNVPVLVCCETHKFSERVVTDAFVYNELGNPDELIDKSDDNSPLKDWRSNPNLTPLNLTYDVTPPSLVTAVVTELAILPCTSAPVVLRFKLSEYGLQG